jgi:hypothetical protein
VTRGSRTGPIRPTRPPRTGHREPQLDDLVRLAGALNARHVRQVLIGGFAVMAHGGAHTTKAIDRLI